MQTVSDAKHEAPKDLLTPAEYIRANFEASDRIAILVRNAKRGETTQRISTTAKITDTPFQDWMRYKNEQDGCDIYVGMNALKATAFTRTKHDVLAIRHLYADLDHDGSASLAAIEKSSLVPAPNYVLNTSPDKYQVIWRVENIDLTQAETLLHAIAREFDGDQAATDAARVLRVPGFMNRKYDQDFLVSAQRHSDCIYHAREFKLRTEPVDSGYRQLRQSQLLPKSSEPRTISQSERDWAHVKSALASGADPEELIAQLAHSRANDKSDPQYYARLTVTKALAELRTPPMLSLDTQIQDSDGNRETKH
jgi:RepB DNA-primase N-terminal domain